jgi:hypothetical protein
MPGLVQLDPGIDRSLEVLAGCAWIAGPSPATTKKRTIAYGTILASAVLVANRSLVFDE